MFPPNICGPPQYIFTHLQGHLYLVDLALDALGDVEEDNDVSGYRGSAAVPEDDSDAMVSTESHPASLHFISVRLLHIGKLPNFRFTQLVHVWSKLSPVARESQDTISQNLGSLFLANPVYLMSLILISV